MPNWKEYKLGEVALDIAYGYTASANQNPVGPKFLRITDIREGNINWDSVPYCSISEKDYKKNKIEVGDIVIARTGATTGITETIKDDVDAVFASYLIRFRINKIVANPFFVGYILKSSLWKDYVASIVGGSAQPGANAKQFADFSITLPDLPTQIAIAEILSSLDDKIGLNNQINQELEALAQALFKRWFIDFEFPNENGQPYKSSGGEMVGSELGEIPKGWTVGPLGEVIAVKHGYAFKGEFFSDSATSNILVTPGNFKIGGGFNYNKFKYYSGESPTEYVLPHEELIVTMTDLSKEGDTLGYPALVPTIRGKRLLHNQRIGKITYKKSPVIKSYMYWLMRAPSYRSFVLSGASGTTVKHTSPSRICEYKAIIPDNNVLFNFNLIVSQHSALEINNNLESEDLSNLRDTLLPRLISGELEVFEALAEKIR